MQFDYLQRVTVDASIDIEDIGNCAICAMNDSADEYYLVIQTEMGWTEVFEYGAIRSDMQTLPENVSMNYSRFEVNPKKISTIITKFLNNAKHFITQAQEIDKATARRSVRDIADYIR